MSKVPIGQAMPRSVLRMHTAPAALLVGILAIVLLVARYRPADAIPAFAAQTGQPCTACHIGAYGPQLTPLGRAFKIGGYTQQGGEGLLSNIPLSAMLITSFTHTNQSVPDDAKVTHYATNNNFSLDQIGGFIAGGWQHTGALIQITY